MLSFFRIKNPVNKKVFHKWNANLLNPIGEYTYFDAGSFHHGRGSMYPVAELVKGVIKMVWRWTDQKGKGTVKKHNLPTVLFTGGTKTCTDRQHITSLYLHICLFCRAKVGESETRTRRCKLWRSPNVSVSCQNTSELSGDDRWRYTWKQSVTLLPNES